MFFIICIAFLLLTNNSIHSSSSDLSESPPFLIITRPNSPLPQESSSRLLLQSNPNLSSIISHDTSEADTMNNFAFYPVSNRENINNSHKACMKFLCCFSCTALIVGGTCFLVKHYPL